MVTKILGNLSYGLVFIISAPAGTGKTTLVRMLAHEFDCVAESVSCTTRKIRPGEISGRDYFFLTEKEFEAKKQLGDFLEYAEVYGFEYGTSREYVSKSQAIGKHVFLVIDTQGAMKLQEEKFRAVYVFLSPPSLGELEQRLCKRQTESSETIEKRLSWAKQEMEMARHYDYHIVNDNLDHAYAILRSIVIAEEHRVRF
jgi:guanylate kinase